MMSKFVVLLILISAVIAEKSTLQQGGTCPCGSAPECPPCILAKTMQKIHDQAEKNALADAATQEQLSQEADLQQKLFEQAEKYAQEAAELERQARDGAVVLQELASKAQIARNKMMRAEAQAKQLAMKALNTMTIHPPHQPLIHMQQVGIAHQTVTQQAPSYQLTIGDTDKSGFTDMIQEHINAGLGR